MTSVFRFSSANEQQLDLSLDSMNNHILLYLNLIDYVIQILN